jgi:septation ring formation regulator EzrA
MKWLLIISATILISITAVVGVMYSQGSNVIKEEDMYMVSHSEYWTGETGQIIARLYDWQGSPITVSNCTVNIYNPDKTPFITNALTNDSLQTTTGSHYYEFATPSTEGIYQYMVTCNYNSKSRSVASSFHLSPALNSISGINQSVTDLTAQELAHFNIIQLNFSSVEGSLTIVKDDLSTVKINLTDIHDDTNYIRDNMVTTTLFNTNITTVINNQATIIAKEDNILTNITVLQQFCDNAETSGSSLCLWVNETKNKLNDVNITVSQYTTILQEINQTTHSTYDYMTGTLATNINNIFGVTTQINSTVNRIEVNTQQINTTVNTIKSTTDTIQSNVSTVIQNQQDTVYMDVTS